jgi:protein-S-isoprenylcysteine O-methyltransferase Ste14
MLRFFDASEFESHHHGSLRILVFALAVLAYQVDRDDIVWSILHWHSPREAALARVIFGFAALLAGLTAALETWTHAFPEAEYENSPASGRIIASGPYRYMRHPLLLAEIIFALALGFFLTPIGAAIALIGTAILNIRLMAREEAKLKLQLGISYPTLSVLVPQFLPSLKPRIAATSSKGQWLGAFRIEAAHWGYFLMMVVFAITLRDSIGWTLAGVAFVVGLLLNIHNPWR